MVEQRKHIVSFGSTKETARLKFSDSVAYVTAEKLLADAMRANGMRTCTETGFSVIRKRGPSATRDKTVGQGERVQRNRTIAPAEKLACQSWQCRKCNTLHTELCKLLTYQASKHDDKIKHRTLCDDMWPRFERARYVLACVTFICVRFMSLWNWTHKMWNAGKWPTPYDYRICRRETSAVDSLF